MTRLSATSAFLDAQLDIVQECKNYIEKQGVFIPGEVTLDNLTTQFPGMTYDFLLDVCGEEVMKMSVEEVEADEYTARYRAALELSKKVEIET